MNKTCTCKIKLCDCTLSHKYIQSCLQFLLSSVHSPIHIPYHRKICERELINAPLQSPTRRVEMEQPHGSDPSTDEEEVVQGKERQYEERIHNLMNQVGTLKNEVSSCHGFCSHQLLVSLPWSFCEKYWMCVKYWKCSEILTSLVGGI